MASDLMSYFLHRRLATPLAVWGKLPSHGDFLRHHVTPAQAHDWQAWVMRVWNLRHLADNANRARALRKPGGLGWMHLEPPATGALDLAHVPVAFVMQPGTLPFAPRHYIQGVILDSEDSVGRVCPIIIYQQVSRGWMPCLLATQSAVSGQDLLYWISRLAARTHAAQVGWTELTRSVDEIWQLHTPGWRHLFQATPPQVDLQASKKVMQAYCSSESMDAARGLRGVHALPWGNWPERVLRSKNPVPAYWQQDIAGGYVNAGDSLLTLWGGMA